MAGTVVVNQVGVHDGGGSLTVDGSVSVSNLPAVQPVSDNGGSLTVDGSISVSNLPAVQPVDDNGASLTVDDGGTSLTVDGAVNADIRVGGAAVTATNPVTVNQIELPTFAVRATNISLGNGKSMISLENASGSPVVIKIRQISLRNVQETNVTGVIVSFALRRADSHSGGTDLGIRSYDSVDTIDSNVTAKFGATITNEDGTSLHIWKISSDEFATNTLDGESMSNIMNVLFPIYKHHPPEKPITLRPGEAITLKCNTNTTAGTFDMGIVFTQETI